MESIVGLGAAQVTLIMKGAESRLCDGLLSAWLGEPPPPDYPASRGEVTVEYTPGEIVELRTVIVEMIAADRVPARQRRLAEGLVAGLERALAAERDMRKFAARIGKGGKS